MFHTYSGVLRYSSFVDAIKLLFSVVATVLLLIIVNWIFIEFYGTTFYFLSTLLMYGVFCFLMLFFLRLGVKTVYDYFADGYGKITPVMIYGTKSSGVGMAKILQSSTDEKYKLVGFIDDDKNLTQRQIMGVKVYFLNQQNIKKIISKKAKAIIISPVKMKEINPEIDLDIFLNNGLSILTFPHVSEWNGENPNFEQIKSVQIEDLLERPEISISCENIAASLHGKIVLVTGAAGSIGSEIARQVIRFQPQLVVLLDQAESPMHTLKLEFEEKFPNQNFAIFLGDIRNKNRMEYMFDLYHPDFVYHAAAYKHVPMMEDNPVESTLVNVMGTKIMADLAVQFAVQRFVMISTDKAVNPTNVMGASKRIAEIYVQSLYRKLAKEINGAATKFITTRFGNVLGSNGSVIPLFKSQIENGGPVTVTHPEIIRYFMTIPEACTLVLEAGAMGVGGEIYIFDMGSPVKIVNLARKMIRLAGLRPDIDIKIEYTGLRPGEKLYEELLNKKEKTIVTHNAKIMIAKVEEQEYETVAAQIDELIRYGTLCKDYLTVSQMKKIVPEFKSKNSQYERLDV
jgi:FlaA1/EpsC-like NDP-sugar epimerase